MVALMARAGLWVGGSAGMKPGGAVATVGAVVLSPTARYLHPDAGRVQEMVEEL